MPTLLARAGRLVAPLAGGWPACLAARAAGRMGLGRMACTRVGAVDFRFDMTDYFEGCMAQHCYEPEIARVLRRTLGPGATYVDVGAQLGYTAALAAQAVGPDGCLVLFEPDPRTAAQLESLAGLHAARPAVMPRVHFVPCACSDRRARIGFAVMERVGWSTAVQCAPHDHVAERIMVPAVLIDDELESRGIDRVRLVKIDAEGYEIPVLRGMRRLVESHRADYVLVECHKHMLARSGHEPGHLHSLLAFNGYAGVCASGRALKPGTLDSARVENLLYAREAPMLERVFAGRRLRVDQPLDARTLRLMYDEACDPDSPRVVANRIVESVRNGNLEAGIEEGENLLREHPDMRWFRGHVAWWLSSAGRKDDARRHYGVMLESVPDDAEVRAALGRLGE